MSAPLVWVVLPLLVAVELLALLRLPRVAFGIAVITAAGLFVAAWLFSAESALQALRWRVVLSPDLVILGRSLTLLPSDRPVLVLLYGNLFLWVAGWLVSGARAAFLPASFALTGLLVAAVAVRPVLFAALFLQLAVLVGVWLLLEPQFGVRRGLLRFWAFQTLALPLILFAGWLLSGGVLADVEAALPLLLLLALGFALLLGVFPFHSWLPMLMAEAQPYSVGLVVSALTLGGLLFGVNLLERMTALMRFPQILPVLLFLGAFSMALGGFSAVLERNAGRVFGFAWMAQVGASLLALGIGGSGGLALFFGLLLPRSMAAALGSLSLARLRTAYGDLSYRKLAGVATAHPLTGLSLLLAYATLAGFPLTGGFVVLWGGWQQAFVRSPALAFWGFVGSAALMGAVFRVLAVLVMDEAQRLFVWERDGLLRIFLILGILALLVLGLLPQWFLPWLLDFGQVFRQFSP
ncbi:MAG: NADH-quinone oxidoreductase subunit M [Anaerolineales bacterium]